jgi:hypothetical protein
VDISCQHFSPSDDVRLRVVEGEAVLLDLASEEIFRLNRTGTRIWLLLVEHHDSRMVLDKLSQEFDRSREELRDDLDEFLEQLLEAGLITPGESGRVQS